MENNNKSYRIHVDTSGDQNIVNVNLNQDYDTFEILSLKLSQENAYKLYESGYGLVVGRIMANGGFGVPNAKISIFIRATDVTLNDNQKNFLYPYTTTSTMNDDNIRYNTLPSEKIEECHQNVGTFPSKRMVLDNDTVLEIYDEYWKYTTVTNQSGDYMIFGVPTGDQTLHVDIDLSDIGILSQRPYDMIYKGYDANLFESPTKFKKSTALDSLPQIYTQNKGIYVYPFWGDSDAVGEDSPIAITRADVQIQYQFEPTCVFMGSIITDTAAGALGKNCWPHETMGKMSDLIAGEGSIEMIRKTITGNIEEYQVKGNRVIDGNGVWCYQIPMNLDYITTDEYGNIVQTDDPTKGIPTRTRVRFRITMDDSVNDETNRKRCKYLVPNNPMVEQTPFTEEEKMSEFDKIEGDEYAHIDYEFGSETREDSFRDLFWNKVYSVKNYIPRLQGGSDVETHKFSGIKLINHYGSNNPFPYNAAHIKLTLLYRFMCVLMKIFINLIKILNFIISAIFFLPCKVCEILSEKIPWPLKLLTKILAWPFCKVADWGRCIGIDSEFCNDEVNNLAYFPGCFGCVCDRTTENYYEEERQRRIELGLPVEPGDIPEPLCQGDDRIEFLMTCIENELAQQNEVVSFDFYNDWINGCLYAPLWYRYIRKKKKVFFGLFTRKAKDQWCSAENSAHGIQIFQSCSLTYNSSTEDSFDSTTGEEITPYHDVQPSENRTCFDRDGNKMRCHDKISSVPLSKGLIQTKETMLGQTVYYYKPMEMIEGEPGEKPAVLPLFSTDIILLGSLNECDLDGVPQFFKYLESTTFNLPTPILFTNNEYKANDDGTYNTKTYVDSTGCDWGNWSDDQCGGSDDTEDSGVYYGIGCSTIQFKAKSCVNLKRACELGVSLDTTQYIPNLNNEGQVEETKDRLVADGFISRDELFGLESRAMFATMNGNRLKTRRNDTNGLFNYDFHYLYPENFDGTLYTSMEERQRTCQKSYRYNYLLEQYNEDYYRFRHGDYMKPLFYQNYLTSDDDNVDRRKEIKDVFNNLATPNKVSLPRYENSFYFYFGIQPGSTAIEQLYSKYFAECAETESDPFLVHITTQENSWCDMLAGELTGGITIEFGDDIATPYSVIVHNNDVMDSEDRYYTNQTGETFYIGYAEDADPRDSEDLEPLTNGNYTITITDNDGKIVEKEIDLNANYLTFYLEGQQSAIDNDTLLNMYDNDCDRIRQEKVGGKIFVRGIAVDGKLMCSEFGECQEGQRTYRIHLYEITTERDEFGVERTIETEISLTEEEEIEATLQICQGDRNFKVVVVETCNGEESENRVEQTIYVSEPGKFKLYINGVDYELIKNFHTGYDNPDSRNPNKFCGWNMLSQINNPYYNWPQEIVNMPKNLRGTYNKETGELYTEAEIAQAVYDAKQDLVNQVREAFWMSCTNDSYKVRLTVEYGQPKILYQMAYDREQSVQDDNEEDGYRLDFVRVPVEEKQYVFDIEEPTLISKENEKAKRGTLVGNYAYLNPDKIPYFVAAFSNYTETDYADTNARRPIKARVGDNKTFFGIHLLEKFFELHVVTWAWVQDKHIFEVFKPADSGTTNEYVAGNYEGFLQGDIYNGITERQLDENGIYRNRFEVIQCGNVIPIYQDDTPAEYEDAMPTIRKILGPCYTDSRFECLNQEGYMRIPRSTATFEIQDYGDCALSQEIHGAMEIVVTDSYCDTYGNTASITVSCLNGPNSEDIQYVLIDWKDPVFPYHHFNPCEDPIFGKDVTNEQILERGIIQRWDDGMNNDGQGSGEQNHHYVTGGTFNWWIKEHEAVYVVALDEYGCRQVSEVYDVRYVDAVLGATNNPQEVAGGSGTTQGDDQFALTIQIKTNSWYISNYTSTIRVIVGNPDSTDAVTFTGTLKGKEVITDKSPLEQICLITVEERIYNAICNILGYNDEIAKGMFEEFCLVEVDDVLGITHRCVVYPGKCKS